jgi:hypothetical protein
LPEIYEYRPGEVENESADVFLGVFVSIATHFSRYFFLETVQKLIFVTICHGWELFHHEEQIRAVISLFSKDLGKFRKK